MGKRTRIDFRTHELIVVDNEHVKIHHLKIKGSSSDNIKFINCGGIMAVTGDYGNWIFCREFVPVAGGHIDEQYASSKLKNSSCQEPFEMDTESTKEEIKELIDSWKYKGEDLKYLRELYTKADCHAQEYKQWAYDNCPSDMFEEIPYREDIKYWLKAVYDGYDEVCNRLTKAEQEQKVK